MKRPPTIDLTTFATAPDEARVRIGTVTALYSVSANTVRRRVKAGLIPNFYKDLGVTYWKAGDLRRALAGTGPQK